MLKETGACLCHERLSMEGFMKIVYFHWFYRKMIDRLVMKTLKGRARDRRDFGKGRLTRAELKTVTKACWKEYAVLAENPPVFVSQGGRAMAYKCIYIQSLYRTIQKAVPHEPYAGELVADFCWKFYEQSAGLPRALAFVLYRSPLSRLRFVVRVALRFAFTSPDFAWTLTPLANGYQVDFHRCQAWEFMKTLEGDELTFFKHCWCNQDRPLNEILVKGGVFQRTHCLAEGDGVCDMKWTTGEAIGRK